MSTDAIRSTLAKVQAAQVRNVAAGKNIARGAGEMRDDLGRRLAELEKTALTDPAAAEEYQRLVHERGNLDIVLGSAKG